MYHSLGAGWTFVVLSGICLAGLPLALVVIRYAKGWRRAREERAAAKRARDGGVSINLGDDAKGLERVVEVPEQTGEKA